MEEVPTETKDANIEEAAEDIDPGDEEVPTETIMEAKRREVDPEDRSCQRYGKRYMGVAAIVVLLLIVISLSIYISVSNQVEQNNKGVSHTTNIISAADGKGVTTTIIYEEVLPGQSQEEDEEDEETVQGEGLVNVPKKLIDFIEKVVTTSPGSDGYRRLNIPVDMIDRMNGNCEYWHMYEPADTTNYMQCGSKSRTENFPLAKGESGGGYMPSDKMIRYLSEATGVSIEALRSIQIGSGVEDSEPGLWCGMPIPGNVDDPTDQNAINYWKTCVQPKAGFFNALQCKGRCTDPNDIKTCSTTANIGFAAVEEGVCYPAHQHMAEEGYWQIAGRGWWRTWLDISVFDNDREFVSANNRVGSNYSFFPQRQDLPHEMDTTNDLDGKGGGEVADGMLMVYFWGKSNDVENNYRHNTDVKSGSTDARIGVGSGSCGNERRIPPYEEGVPMTINTNNC